MENALCLPMHMPLGVALTHFIAETEIPTIAHHHDFHWERARFSVNAVDDFLAMAFPPCVGVDSARDDQLLCPEQPVVARRRFIDPGARTYSTSRTRPLDATESASESFRQRIGARARTTS